MNPEDKPDPKSSVPAQERADRIRIFREELEQLEREDVLIFSGDQLRELNLHHDRVLEDLSRRFAVDTNLAQKQMSWAMRIASLLGALAFSAAAFFFFYRFWGLLSTPVQIGILIGGTTLALLAMEVCARRETTLYFATLIGVVALACFVLNVSVLGTIFNIRPSQSAFLIWALFAFLLAYTYGIRLLQAAGILCFLGFLSATMATWSGMYWLSFGERPENFLPSGIFLFLVPAVVGHRKYPRFPVIYRIFGLIAMFIAILILANWGSISYLWWDPERIEVMYQIFGFLAAALTIWAGIHWRWPAITNVGTTFFVIFLYTKFIDWWWDYMPKYLFFLIMGGIAVALLWGLKVYRTRSRKDAE